jgi:hypothetical protein
MAKAKARLVIRHPGINYRYCWEVIVCNRESIRGDWKDSQKEAQEDFQNQLSSMLEAAKAKGIKV